MKFLDGIYAMADGLYIQRTEYGWCVVGPKLIKELKDLDRIKQLSRRNPGGD